MEIIYFPSNLIHTQHNDRIHGYFGRGFDSLSVIKHLKAKLLSDGELRGKILSNWGACASLAGS